MTVDGERESAETLTPLEDAIEHISFAREAVERIFELYSNDADTEIARPDEGDRVLEFDGGATGIIRIRRAPVGGDKEFLTLGHYQGDDLQQAAYFWPDPSRFPPGWLMDQFKHAHDDILPLFTRCTSWKVAMHIHRPDNKIVTITYPPDFKKGT